MRHKLNETTNLLALYQHHVGQSEVPMDYHTWCCLAGVAACVADRVWYHKFKRAKVNPSLFTFLIGPSAVGKGDAIEVIARYLDGIPAVNQFVGNITPEAMLELMGGPPVTSKRKEKHAPAIERSKIFLVTEELAMAVGEGPRAKTFVRDLTGLYKKIAPTFRHATVSGANAVVKNPCINWLAGTTVEWMVDSIPPQSIKGGFVGRIIPVVADYDFETRYFDPIYPDDYDEVEAHLLRRFMALTKVTGEFRMTKRAKRIERMWYYGRTRPTDPLLFATFRRQHDMVLKMAQTFSLCESHDLVIRARHMELALKAVTGSYRAVKMIVRAALQTTDTKAIDFVASVIRRRHTIREATLLEVVAQEGIGYRAFHEAVRTLNVMQKIKIVKFTKGGHVKDVAYEWLERRMF